MVLLTKGEKHEIVHHEVCIAPNELNFILSYLACYSYTFLIINDIFWQLLVLQAITLQLNLFLCFESSAPYRCET